jgi:starvation-inducible DNA-binding protein
MTNLNPIGLDRTEAASLSKQLKALLANYSIFYQNTRGYHWNIRGEKFFELHLKFEELYNDLLLKIDEIAERILTLGHHPTHNYSEYARVATIQESPLITEGPQAVAEILEAFKAIMPMQRALLKQAAEIGDEGTSALMSDYIRAQEKMIWMYSAYLNNI